MTYSGLNSKMTMGNMLKTDCSGARLEQRDLLGGYDDSPDDRGQWL